MSCSGRGTRYRECFSRQWHAKSEKLSTINMAGSPVSQKTNNVHDGEENKLTVKAFLVYVRYGVHVVQPEGVEFY